jgi:hypothetical protein
LEISSLIKLSGLFKEESIQERKEYFDIKIALMKYQANDEKGKLEN